MAIVALILIASGVVFYSIYNKNNPHPVASGALIFSYNVVLHILFIAGFKLLMTPWWCNPATGKLYAFEDVDCFVGSNLPNLIVGSIFAVILLFMVCFASLATVNLSPVPNDLFAVTTPVYRLSFYFVLVFMTINENLIAKVIGYPHNLTLTIEQHGIWWEALMNWIMMTILFGVLVYTLPYQVSKILSKVRFLKEIYGAVGSLDLHGGLLHAALLQLTMTSIHLKTIILLILSLWEVVFFG